MGLISFLEDHLLSCQWKENFGVECMGCGMQRALIALLKGDFIEAFRLYPAIYTLIVMFVFLLLHLKFNFSKGAKVLYGLFILNLAVIVISYILKFI